MKKNVNGAIAILFSTFFLFAMTSQLHAQMFSVGEEGPRFNTPLSELYLGLEPMTMEYKGDSNQLGAGAFEFDGPIIRAGYNSSSLDVFLGTGGEITGMEDASYFDVGGNIDFGVDVLRNQKLRLQVPFRVAFRYTNITNDDAIRIPNLSRFQFGSLTGGAGAGIVARPARNFRIVASGLANYGFAFASGGFFGGSLASISAKGRLYFDRLFDDIGLSLGYDYNLRNYNIDDDLYDYEITGHSLTVGITY